MLRGCYHMLETALPPGALQIVHLFGHLQEPSNEFVDHVAKKEAHSSYFLQRPHFNLPKWKQLVPHLWLIFARQAGAPDFSGGGFNVPPPDLPGQTTEGTNPTGPDQYRFYHQPSHRKCLVTGQA